MAVWFETKRVVSVEYSVIKFKEEVGMNMQINIPY